ncbi:hypothetical protein [uncultured Tateyamaria sp.]|uniref:hypothetical protein n=1 Tax=uncultured Tateyamaria sp. TaxID=455651 RepID=UPI002606967D|nr:hypothetical protein [uncultured Tateyamaria sp.]
MRTEDLDGLTSTHPDCIIAAYADIETGVTLLTNSNLSFPREALDELCVEAALTLGTPDAPPLGGMPCNEAIKVDDTALFLYLRAPDEATDALICMCRPTVEITPFLKAARACLSDPSAEGTA